MRQPIKKQKNNKIVAIKNVKKENKKQIHPQYGTSKLEEDFAHNFLDKLGVKYIYQFEAKDIGRFFDFYLQDENLIIEVDGDYW
jgi:very-short-patch-repair endonuclease